MVISTRIEFCLSADRGKARCGQATVRGRSFRTPAFMPVGTAATVKGMTPVDLQEAGAEVVLSNTYHLRLRPGPELVREFGGLHRFMGWEGAILTDSGGYQIFSLARLAALDDDGVTFQSHLDGERIHLTPEEAVRIQLALDSDIAMVLDQPVALPAERSQVQEAAARTLLWAERSLASHRALDQAGQALFGIVQGAVDLEIRADQAERLSAMGFDGYAVGGLSVGESKQEMAAVLDTVLPILPVDRPRYVMGIGYPQDLLMAIERGADMFDCVLPTRHARTGQAFTSVGVVRLRHAAQRTARGPLDPHCTCFTCSRFELGYLSHLYHSNEMLGPILVARHNVHFYETLVREAGDAIEAGAFTAYRDRFLHRYLGEETSDS